MRFSGALRPTCTTGFGPRSPQAPWLRRSGWSRRAFRRESSGSGWREGRLPRRSARMVRGSWRAATRSAARASSRSGRSRRPKRSAGPASGAASVKRSSSGTPTRCQKRSSPRGRAPRSGSCRGPTGFPRRIRAGCRTAGASCFRGGLRTPPACCGGTSTSGRSRRAACPA